MPLTLEEKQTIADLINAFYKNNLPLHPGFGGHHDATKPVPNKLNISVTTEMVTDETADPVCMMLCQTAWCTKLICSQPPIEITHEGLNKLVVMLAEYRGEDGYIKIINIIGK